MNITYLMGVLALFGLLYLWVGKNSAKNQNSNDDYFLMGRSLGYLPLLLTLLATQLGGGALIGAAEEAYNGGWLVLFYPLGISLGLIFLGSGFGAKLRENNVSTIAELFETIYGSSIQRKTASFLSIMSLFLVLIAQSIAARMFFVGLGFENPLIFVFFWIILITYTVMGGLKAVVNTDILQACFIIFSLVLVFFSFDSPSLSVDSQVQLESSVNVPWMTWLLMPLLFMLIEQDMGQRCFAAKNSRTVSLSALTAGFVFFGCSSIAIYVGVMSQKSGAVFEGNQGILIGAVQMFTSPFVSTLFMGAIFMAVISTADSLLCSIGSNLSCDFFSVLDLPEKKQVTLSRFITLVVGIISLALSFSFDSVIGMLMLSYELTVSVLLIPLLGAIYTKNPRKEAAAVSMAVGFLCFVSFKIIDPILPKEILTLCLTFIAFLIVSKQKRTVKVS